MRRVALVIVGGLATGLGIGLAGGVRDLATSAWAQDGGVRRVAATANGRSAEETSVIRAARQISPAVVSVTREGASGSGVIIRADGVILTNAHVVGGERAVVVTLADGRQLPGRVLGRDPTVDIAVVQASGTGLPSAPLGDSDQLEVGQVAIAIGNPVGLERTVTSGIVSAINRSPRGFELGGLIQTDAAINPGNSGGPLLDSQGRVIGINTAIIPSATGLGFAIPINLARNIAEQLITTGRVRRAVLGIVPVDVTPPLAQQLGLPVREGVLVYEIEQDTDAYRVGLRPGDIITRINDTNIEQSGDMRRVLRAVGPGGTVRVQVVRRGGSRQTFTVRLGEQIIQ